MGVSFVRNEGRRDRCTTAKQGPKDEMRMETERRVGESRLRVMSIINSYLVSINLPYLIGPHLVFRWSLHLLAWIGVVSGLSFSFFFSSTIINCILLVFCFSLHSNFFSPSFDRVLKIQIKGSLSLQMLDHRDSIPLETVQLATFVSGWVQTRAFVNKQGAPWRDHMKKWGLLLGSYSQNMGTDGGLVASFLNFIQLVGPWLADKKRDKLQVKSEWGMGEDGEHHAH